METKSCLIDVLSPESFDAEHLPGAENFCVYETAFVDKVRAAFPDLDHAITVYGLSDSTQEADVAIEKLKEAGYTRVSKIAGGLEGKKAAGETIQSGESKSPTKGGFKVNAAESSIRWTGRNLFNFHVGELKLKGGKVTISEGELTDGQFVIDMQSISCSDLTDSKMNAMLVGHLKSGDFFQVDEFPEASLTIISATPIAEATTGMPNYCLAGTLTLRGISAPLEFVAVVAEKDEESYIAQAVMEIDRTLWGSQYGSGKFFARLGQHVVNDQVLLHVKIVLVKG